MKGKILDYSIQESKGLITGDDGNRYNFQNSEWKATKVPSINQRVDFEIDGKNAIGIYLDASASFDAEKIKSSLSDIQNSDLFTSVQGNVTKIVRAGIQNKVGFIISVLMAIALFFPIITIPFIGSVSLVNYFWGKVAFLLLIILSILFYSGVKRIFVKIVVGLVAAIVMLVFFDLYSGLSQGNDLINSFSGKRGGGINLFEMLRFGVAFVIPLSLALLIVGFKSNYKENI